MSELNTDTDNPFPQHVLPHLSWSGEYSGNCLVVWRREIGSGHTSIQIIQL
jgi:hypothetical protein